MPCKCVNQSLGAGEITLLLFLTYTKRFAVTDNNLNGSFVSGSSVNYIPGYVRPAAAREDSLCAWHAASALKFTAQSAAGDKN